MPQSIYLLKVERSTEKRFSWGFLEAAPLSGVGRRAMRNIGQKTANVAASIPLRFAPLE
jgi:hypothetical protein